MLQQAIAAAKEFGVQGQSLCDEQAHEIFPWARPRGFLVPANSVAGQQASIRSLPNKQSASLPQQPVMFVSI